MSDRVDIHQHVTDRIIAAIEAGAGEWKMPWIGSTGGRKPTNVTGRDYNGVNILTLWVEQQIGSYSSHVWGTYRQWQDKGCQVRKGSRSSLSVFYKTYEVEDGDGEADKRWVARATPVFNADQVEGFTEDLPFELSEFERNARAEAFVIGTGAALSHEGHRAYYRPSTDQIVMPPRELFKGSPTSTPAESYYSTMLHELTHWTGSEKRLKRDFGAKFEKHAYAVEELVAELGAAFLCADLAITNEPRADHAQYLAHWLSVLKADKRAIFTAASKASAAAAYLHSLQGAAQLSQAA